MKRWKLSTGLLVAATAVASFSATPALALMRAEAVSPTGTTITKTPVIGPLPVDLVKGFTVTTNSVVGTATVNYSAGIVTVRWGDGTRTTYDPRYPMTYDSNITV